MIELRRSFAVACGLTILVVLLLAACDFRTPAESAQATPSASVASASAPAAVATTNASAAPASSAPTPSPTPSVPQGGALAIRLAADVPDLKPWDLRSRGEEVVADLMYSGLTRLDPQLRPQPDLAESWTTSPDGGLITFTLRSGMTWHDGQPLTSDDVVWTLNTLRTITPTNALLFDLRSTIGQVRSPLTETVVLSLTQPYAPLLAELAVPILPRHRLQARTPEQIASLDFWQEPVGSGPFKFDQRQPNQSITFTRNEQFYRGAPNIDQIALVVAPDPAVAATALREGQLQAAEFPGQVAPLTDTDQTITSGAYPENGWYGVVFNTRADRLFADQRLRAAVARALDINDLVQAVTGGVGQPIATTLSRAAWAYPADLPVLPPDLDAARQLLDEAGWTVGPDGVVAARRPGAAVITVSVDSQSARLTLAVRGSPWPCQMREE